MYNVYKIGHIGPVAVSEKGQTDDCLQLLLELCQYDNGETSYMQTNWSKSIQKKNVIHCFKCFRQMNEQGNTTLLSREQVI